MQQNSMNITQRKWYDSAHASLCLLGAYLCRMDFFAPLERLVHIHQKVLKYTPTQKLEMLFVGLLAGSKAVCHTTTAVRIDPALISALRACWLCRAVRACRYARCCHRGRCRGVAGSAHRDLQALQPGMPA